MEPGGDLGCGLLSRISSKSARFSLVSLGINWGEKHSKQNQPTEKHSVVSGQTALNKVSW